MHFIIADDHPLSLLGTQVLVDSLGHVVLGTYKDGQSAWNSIKILKPDFVILDISMPEMSGLEISEKIRVHQLPTKIILLTSHKEKSIFQKAEELQINAYLLKQYALDELRDCIKHLSTHEKYFSRKLNFDLEKDVNYLKGEVMEQLSFSERKVFEFIIEQKTTKEIAALLFLSEKTIEAHRAAIIRKLGLEPQKNALLKFAVQFKDASHPLS
ncbi:response regulator transcription factor [Moheibacter sediminis]|uniref:Two component transcriptional regulator, LuxR family n=1 Tax=Moheibacter sediminis TaxID=1434700 RepID=A0A1W2BTQ9_9FLAO|nr:response regulator transcription factor [Moheibacter sediminis]SMC76377.1 two component transcriptional regulator, LuxR family [Moheibacter sediminis]